MALFPYPCQEPLRGHIPIIPAYRNVALWGVSRDELPLSETDSVGDNQTVCPCPTCLLDQ